MKEVYIVNFYPSFDKDFHVIFEICETKELAIKYAEDYLKRHEIVEIERIQREDVLRIQGRTRGYTGFQVNIKKKRIFSSIEELPNFGI